MSDERAGQTREVLRGNGRVTANTRRAGSDVEFLEIEEVVEEQWGDLDGDGITEMEVGKRRAEIRKRDAWFVLQALADYYNMELTEA